MKKYKTTSKSYSWSASTPYTRRTLPPVQGRWAQAVLPTSRNTPTMTSASPPPWPPLTWWCRSLPLSACPCASGQYTLVAILFSLSDCHSLFCDGRNQWSKGRHSQSVSRLCYSLQTRVQSWVMVIKRTDLACILKCCIYIFFIKYVKWYWFHIQKNQIHSSHYKIICLCFIRCSTQIG